MIFCKYFFITLVTNSKQKSRGKKNSPASHFNFLFSSDERQFLHQNLKMSSQFFGRISTISSHSTTSSLLLVSSMILLSSLPIFSRFLALGMYCVDGRSLLSFRQISSQVSAYPGSSDSLGGYCYRVVSGHVFSVHSMIEVYLLFLVLLEHSLIVLLSQSLSLTFCVRLWVS